MASQRALRPGTARTSLGGPVRVIASRGTGRRDTVFLTASLAVYLSGTAILYNNFFGLEASSRWPLLIAGFFLGPLALGHLLLARRSHFTLRPSLGLFLGCYLLIEVFHAGLGSPEFVGIASLLSLLGFLILTARFSKEQIVSAVVACCLLYLLFIYPLAIFHGMVGGSSSDKGVFVTQYLPSLSTLIINGEFKSGRGVVGMIGAVVAICSIVRLKRQSVSPLHLAALVIGLFALFVSDSRGPIFSFLLITLALLFPVRPRLRARLLFLLPAAIVLLQPVLLVFSAANPGLFFSLSPFSRQDIAASDVTRALGWAESFGLTTASAKSVLFGYGAIGSMDALHRTFLQRYPGIEELMSAHNLLLQILLDGGVMLLLGFLLYLFRITAIGWKHAAAIEVQDLDGPALISFLLLCSVTGSVLSLDRVNEAMFLLVLTFAALEKQMCGGRFWIGYSATRHACRDASVTRMRRAPIEPTRGRMAHPVHFATLPGEFGLRPETFATHQGAAFRGNRLA